MSLKRITTGGLASLPQVETKETAASILAMVFNSPSPADAKTLLFCEAPAGPLERLSGIVLALRKVNYCVKGYAMKSYTEYLWFNTRKHREFINITGDVEKALAKSQIKEGLILVSAMHITAGIYVNDAEDGLIADIDEWLEKLAPFRAEYRHHRTGEDNGDSHLKSLLIGHQAVVPVTDGKLDFGPWQQVYYAEFDGQRRKRVLIKVIGE
jgi:secondary thiamine-phosphate synthase enzyme